MDFGTLHRINAMVLDEARCRGHHWVAPSMSVIPDVGHPTRPIMISRPTTYCKHCGIKWDDYENAYR